MRDLKLMIGYILVIIGFFLIIAANITALGSGLYDWAFNADLAMAAWGAFVLWLKMIGTGVGSLIIGMVLGEGQVTSKKRFF